MDWLWNISLMSDQAIWGIRIALLVAVVWVVARWGRSASNTVWSVLRRLAALAVVSLLTVLALAAPVNAEYGWYPTIGDVLPGSAQGQEVTSAEPAAAAVARPVTSSPLITGPRNRPAEHLTLTGTASGAGYQDFTVRGQRSGMTGIVTVWFPKEYISDTNREFPVIEGFHGIKPAPYAFFNAVHMDQAITGLAASGKMRPSLLVIPHWAPGGLDNECVDSAAGGNVETWLTQDIPDWVYSTFRVLPGRGAFAAWGMSAGGWCANMSAMLHPDTFATAVSLGGYWQPDFDPSFVPFRPGSAEMDKYDLISLAHKRPPSVALWTLYGKSDVLAAPTSGAMMAAVTKPTSLTSIVLPRGGHNTAVWLPHVQPSLEWLAGASPDFRAS